MKIASPETLARLLSRRLAERGDPGRAITLEQLLDDVLDYAAVRRELGLAAKGEYDIAILGLLTHRSLLQVDPAVAAAARKELESPEPSLGFSRTFADHLLRLRPGATLGEADDDLLADADADTDVDDEAEPGGAEEADLHDPAAGEAGSAPEPAETADGPLERGGGAGDAAEPTIRSEPVIEPEPPAGPPADSEIRPTTEPDDTPAIEPLAPTRCWACSAAMPMRDGLRYCPHCGADQAARRCVACGERLDREWRFCPRCGRGLEET